ncbi:MAG: RNA polymerase sigma factor, partial [Acidobacteria bacterium]|nr:RNA polymerase sigma factor [Acidobacteriota bacterium]
MIQEAGAGLRKRNSGSECLEDCALPVFRLLCGMTGSVFDAEDLIQETLLAAHAQRASFRGDSSLLTWVTGIALNLARRQLRRRSIEGRPRRLEEEARRLDEPDQA